MPDPRLKLNRYACLKSPNQLLRHDGWYGPESTGLVETVVWAKTMREAFWLAERPRYITKDDGVWKMYEATKVDEYNKVTFRRIC